VAALSRFGVARNPGSEVGVALWFNSGDSLFRLSKTEVVYKGMTQASNRSVSREAPVTVEEKPYPPSGCVAHQICSAAGAAGKSARKLSSKTSNCGMVSGSEMLPKSKNSAILSWLASAMTAIGNWT
jgi:hypothetical protein